MPLRIRRLCSFALIAALLNTASCGYLIYPERQGLRGDKVDGTIVALDAIGLLLLLPGIIAFAVDFSTGCIYLPESKQDSFSMSDAASARWVPVAKVAPYADDAAIAAALQRYLNADKKDLAAKNNTAAQIEWHSAYAFTFPVVAQLTE